MRTDRAVQRRRTNGILNKEVGCRHPTQRATIHLPAKAANKLVETAKIKVERSVCSLHTVLLGTEQMERCFKYMEFGDELQVARANPST